MSDQPNSILPRDQSRVLTELAGAVASARAKLTALRPLLPPDGAQDDSPPPWRQALDSIESHRLPGLIGDLESLALDDLSPDPALEFRVQQALCDLTAEVSAIKGALVTSPSASCVLAGILPKICSAILAVVLELLSVAEVRLERQLAEPDWNPAEPPEIHLLAGARLGGLQVEVAIAELQDGYLRFQNAIEQGAPTDVQRVES